MKPKINSVIWKQGRKKNTQVEQQKEERILKTEESLRNILDNMKHNNIHIMGIPEGVKSEQRVKKLLEIMTKNLADLMKGKDTQIQEAQRVPN